MNERDWLAERFEAHRDHLQSVAYRMLGSLTEAEDAVQEAWLRLSRSGTDGVENLGGWLTTVVSRVCLDMLRTRKSRREQAFGEHSPEPAGSREEGTDPEREVLLADSVGVAMLVVLDNLAPAERLAFVLHDMFDVPFDDIAPIVDRSPAAARQLASRARRRVRGPAAVPAADLSRQRELVEAFFAAARAGDFAALLSVLDPDVELRIDRAGLPAAVLRGADIVAKRAAIGAARAGQPALINGEMGIVVAPRGRLVTVLGFTIDGGKIVGIDAISDPERLRQLDLAVLDA